MYGTISKNLAPNSSPTGSTGGSGSTPSDNQQGGTNSKLGFEAGLDSIYKLGREDGDAHGKHHDSVFTSPTRKQPFAGES